MDQLLPVGDGHTLLGADDLWGLKLSYITTRGELNEAEQANILRATGRARPPSVNTLLDDLYLRRLHQRMFGDVWSWAGKYRTVETHIGIDPVRISVAVRNLVEDGRVWVEAAADEPDLIAAQFHSRLVAIHPFANGNGRHSRVAADYLVLALERPAFTWGANQTASIEELRRQYIAALLGAEKDNDLDPLVGFARS